jgi:hypothetical protein
MTQMKKLQTEIYSATAEQIASDLRWMQKLDAVVAHSGIIEKIARISADLETDAITAKAAVNQLEALRSMYWRGK